MIISFYSLKVIIFFNLFSAFFKKIAGQTYFPRFLSYKEKLCSAKKETFYGGGLLFRLIKPVSETNLSNGLVTVKRASLKEYECIVL
jgi:hypothetical protein